MQRLKEDLQRSYQLVRDRCMTEHKRQKAIYDEKGHGGHPSIKAILSGCILLLYLEGCLGSYIVPAWKGPFKVVEQIVYSTYKIKGIWGTKTQIVHFDRLKLCPAKIRLDNRQ